MFRLDEAQKYGNSPQTQAGIYDRNHPRYPYKSHAQWLKAGFGMVACIILLVFNGVNAFLTDPFDIRTFIASYISVRPSLNSGKNLAGRNQSADWLIES
jgi:amino acid transporter